MDKDPNEKLHNIRHSVAHLLAQAVMELYPGTKMTIGPVIENGFFYDFLPPQTFKEEDLPAIEKKMRQLAKKNFKIEGKQISKDEARELFKGNEFKQELIDGIEDETVGVFTQGNFSDLCKGGHVSSTAQLKHFKLMSVAGAYWRADKENAALQRIYGIAFETKEELDAYLKRIEEAKLYDHRKLGKQLGLISFHKEAPGMVFFHDKGTIIFNLLVSYLRKLQDEAGYKEIRTPLIMHESLWKKSGHYDNYKDNMYFTTIDDETHCIRPMNCPGGVLIYQETRHSYRELPLRIAEFGIDHRYELSGVMHGMFRVRSFTMDDAHIYCTQEQIEQEVSSVVDLAMKLYKKFGFEDIILKVATRPEKSMGTQELWDIATQALKDALDHKGFKYDVVEGEGAFYGPKIELHFTDAMGRQWQCGTVQVDFNLPERFKLEYIDSDQSRKTPVMIHRALYGSMERFIGILIEHFKGHFPFWLAPVQVRVLTITDKQHEYARRMYEQLKAAGIRVEHDHSGDQIGAQIRRAQVEKLPWMIVIGEKEQTNNTLTLRYTNGKQEFGLTFEQVVERANALQCD